MPGAARLLRHLHRHKIPTALATSTPAKYLGVKMASHDGWIEKLDAVCTGDEVTNGKPAPDIFTLAARRLGADPATCVVLEDTPLGIQAAKAAGMFAVAVPSIQDASLYETADEVARSLYDIRPESWGLPPFDDWMPNPTPGLDPVLPLDPPVRLGGPVVKGFGRGSKMLGIPTANLDATPLKLESDALAPGIYFGWAGLWGAQGGTYPMVMSIGWNPFFDNSSKTIEPWLLRDFPDDFYDQELRLVVLGYVRPRRISPPSRRSSSAYTKTRGSRKRCSRSTRSPRARTIRTSSSGRRRRRGGADEAYGLSKKRTRRLDYRSAPRDGLRGK